MISLDNKKALVTGATRGIGKEIADLLEKEGCKVFRAGKSDGDLTSPVGIFRLVQRTVMELGYIDILVNNAGIYMRKSIEDCSVEEFDKLFNINVRTPWYLCKIFIPYMKKQKWGRIVNIGSLASYHGHSDQSIYNASKHAILGMSRSLFKELNDHNIRVICISPGGTRTEGMGRACVGTQDFNTFIDPKEIAEHVVFNLKFNDQLVNTEIQLNRIHITRLEKII